MTIDERLEALTHSVELIAQMQIRNEKNIKRLGRYIGSIGQMVLDHEARLRALEDGEESGEDTSE